MNYEKKHALVCNYLFEYFNQNGWPKYTEREMPEKHIKLLDEKYKRGWIIAMFESQPQLPENRFYKKKMKNAFDIKYAINLKTGVIEELERQESNPMTEVDLYFILEFICWVVDVVKTRRYKIILKHNSRGDEGRFKSLSEAETGIPAMINKINDKIIFPELSGKDIKTCKKIVSDILYQDVVEAWNKK